jgi:translation initiation factor IF-2
MSNPVEGQGPAAGPATPGQLPRAPKMPRQGSGGRAGAPNQTVYLLEEMAVRELASALQLKPFKVIADLMEQKVFKSAEDTVDFETAALVARKHGYRAERPPPGVLVL